MGTKVFTHHNTMIFYRLLIITLSPIIVGYTLWLSIKNKNSRYFWQRLGFSYSSLPKNSLWFHCASVGEVNTVLPLLRNLHKKNNNIKIIITTNTITGGKITSQQNLDYIYHCYMPIDWFRCIKKFISTVNPLSINIMETEIWPNLFTTCHNRNIPIYIINARLSEKTTSANSWIKEIYKTCLPKVSAIYARSEEDAKSYISLGAKNDTTSTLGNLKFTSALANNNDINTNRITERKYVLVASTHKNEELNIFNVWKSLNRKELLVIAPRHPERSASIIKQLNTKNISIKSKNQTITEQTEVFLLDTIGELNSYFNKAELVIMGGSFTPIGGHNILEPASFNKAIITGPYMNNFLEELRLMHNKHAIVHITSKSQAYTHLKNEIENILDDDSYKESLQKNTLTLSHNVKSILDNYTNTVLKNHSMANDTRIN